MLTTQIMKRALLGMDIQQRTSDGYFLLTSIDRAGALYRLQHNLPSFNVSSFLSNKGQVEFLAELEAKTGAPVIVRTGRGRGSVTWVHPFVMLEIAMAMAPGLKVEVYSWLYDELIKYRDNSGDSYKKMSGALYHKFPNPRTFQHFIADTANQIREACGVSDAPKPWNSATEAQLKLRDKIHETISIAADWFPDPRAAVRMGIARAIKDSPMHP